MPFKPASQVATRSNDGNFGRVEAIDLKTRQVVWSERQRAPIASSLLASAGGLVFSGARDRHFRAYDAATGKVLWLREYGCNIVAKIDYHSLTLETKEGKKRVCWNSEIAPHNFEGFFLNMGDMLVKAGDWETARKIYGDAKLSSTYSQWQYRQVLEDRIRDAQDNVAAFNAPADATNRGDKRIMVTSAFSCMACHRQ